MQTQPMHSAGGLALIAVLVCLSQSLSADETQELTNLRQSIEEQRELVRQQAETLAEQQRELQERMRELDSLNDRLDRIEQSEDLVSTPSEPTSSQMRAELGHGRGPPAARRSTGG